MSPERQRLARMLFDEYIAMYSSRDARLVDRFSHNFSGFAGSSDKLKCLGTSASRCWTFFPKSWRPTCWP